MDAEEAQKNLAAARTSYEASVTPALPAWAPPLCGLMVGGGVALAGIGAESAWVRVAGVVVGVGLALGARALLNRIRARRGVTGVRGPAARTQSTLVVAGAAYVIGAMNATPQTRWVFLGMGVVVGAIVWVSLAKKVRR
ncbi:hypothetical protein [Streptomyces sp. NPDC088746]|uniref:hypothetical protein n=1 Tax=Streptomyces sp. NPDC088746 TaxID=3365885 RepID=UPI003812E676